MIHHQKGKNLTFMMAYVRLRKTKPVKICGRLKTWILSQRRWYMSESTHVVSQLGLEGDVKRQQIAF